MPYVDLYPLQDWSGREREVEVGGVRATLHAGRNRIRLGLEKVSSLRVTITRVDQPPGDLRGGGGFREIRIPGVSVKSSLRPPVLAGRALAGRDLSRVGLTYLFERTTADAPFRRDRHTGSPLLELASNRRDTESRLDRLIFAPAPRRYDVDAWMYPAVDARDRELDRLAGVSGPRLIRLVGALPQRAALPGVQRIRPEWADCLGGHLGASVSTAPVDLLVGTTAARAVAPPDRAGGAGAPPQQCPVELARGDVRAAPSWRGRRGRARSARTRAQLQADRSEDPSDRWGHQGGGDRLAACAGRRSGSASGDGRAPQPLR